MILVMFIFTSAVKVRMKVVKMTTAQQNLGESTAKCRIILLLTIRDGNQTLAPISTKLCTQLFGVKSWSNSLMGFKMAAIQNI